MTKTKFPDSFLFKSPSKPLRNANFLTSSALLLLKSRSNDFGSIQMNFLNLFTTFKASKASNVDENLSAQSPLQQYSTSLHFLHYLDKTKLILDSSWAILRSLNSELSIS